MAADVVRVSEWKLTLQDFGRLVVQNNETLQAKMLEVEIAQHRYRGAYGMFEPEMFTTAQHEENNRRNTAEQASSQTPLSILQNDKDVFREKNNIYTGGIESLLPTGTRLQLGYSLRQLENNLQIARALQQNLSLSNLVSPEYQSFVGITLTQPLAKNFGPAYTLAEIRVQAINSDIAFQEYRRQLMTLLTTAEAAYWNLFLSQEQERSIRESVSVAETVLQDAKTRRDAGKGADLDVLEAQSAFALRRAKLSEAQQHLRESANQVLSMIGNSAATTNGIVRTVDRPEVLTNSATFFEAWRSAFDLNPDYLAARYRCKLEGVRIAYANNQLLPQVDFKASYGLNGLGDSPGTSFADVERQGFPSWSVGMELRFPLGGGIKARNERDAARLGQQKSLLELKSLETQIANATHTALYKIEGRRDSIPESQSVVTYAQNLLQTELARFEVGKVESRKVLETEAALFEARIMLAENLVQYRRAWLEKELVEGSVLKNRGLDMTQEELTSRTRTLLRGGGYVGGTLESNAPRVTEVLGEEPGFKTPSTPPQTDDSNLRRALRESLKETKP
ncbi:MAG: TolC family protein [Verrucomicrobia bacterium]|nr:TolC family protein [Verrucomicrobiota bacterium]